MFIYILLVLSILLCVFIKSKKGLHMLQQNLYNENNRYIRWVSKNKRQLFNLDVVAVLLAVLGYVFAYDLPKTSILLVFLMITLYSITSFSWNNQIRNDQNKKPLVITARIKRLIITISILYLIPISIIIFLFEDAKIVWICLLILSIMISLHYLVIYFANIINYPIERIVYHYYEGKAKKKLHSMERLKVIGITGSYGKTSSKNILSDILNVKYITRPTPKNLNTYYGLMITINNYLDKFDEFFVAEMGAYVKGEIKGLCDLVHPKYGILTTIGTAHLETFGSEENIIKGKFELIESLPSDGIGVLNGDDPKQVGYKLKNDCKIIWIGIDNKEVDICASNIKCNYKGTSFDVKFKNDKKTYSFETKLLGKHNVYNILASVALGYELGISVTDLCHAVKMVKPVEHRLELKRLGNFYQIDDAYNSNPVGAKSALDVLSMMPGVKVVITPGMIELGAKEDEYNHIFGEQIAGVADYVVLIGEKKTKPIYEGLKEQNYDMSRVIIYNDVKDAYIFIAGLHDKNGVYALFENDLPDTYNE